jgi:glyoxylase-like metal-dependent hydrolase (beta-lactamase superfamily II)
MAKVKILLEGFTTADSKGEGEEEKTRATITLIQDNGLNIVVDPGVVESQQEIINKLAENNLQKEDIDYVFLTHSHIDHYRNTGIFANAKTLEFFGLWSGNSNVDWREKFSDDIKIIKTPGHSNDSLTFLVKSDLGIVAICGDVFWKENFPDYDEYAVDQEVLKESRKTLLSLADYVIPGHGEMFKVNK